MGGCFRNVSFIIFIIFIMERLTDVSTECNNYWLDQYEDVLPTINNRPEFPDSITDAFEVFEYPIKLLSLLMIRSICFLGYLYLQIILTGISFWSFCWGARHGSLSCHFLVRHTLPSGHFDGRSF